MPPAAAPACCNGSSTLLQHARVSAANRANPLAAALLLTTTTQGFYLRSDRVDAPEVPPLHHQGPAWPPPYPNEQPNPACQHQYTARPPLP